MLSHTLFFIFSFLSVFKALLEHVSQPYARLSACAFFQSIVLSHRGVIRGCGFVEP